MKFKPQIFDLLLIFFVCFTSYAQSQDIRYFPVGELTLCKGCGHAKSNTWRGKFRIENLSDNDFTIYGHYYDGKFSPGGLIQRKNPNLCEWRYGNGKAKYIDWSEESSFDKEEFILKSKQAIEFESHFSNFDLGQTTRFTVYIKEESQIEPQEAFSNPFTLEAAPVLDSDGKLLKYENPVLILVDDNCTTNCKISIDQAPSIRGIKLRMSLEDFKKVFPKVKIHNSKEKNYNIKWAWFWDWNEDVFDLDLTFLNDRIAAIEAKFRSLEGKRVQNDFYLMVSKKLGLEDIWKSNRKEFECRDFLIEVVPNEIPDIMIWDKSYITVRDKINEEDLKKTKIKKN